MDAGIELVHQIFEDWEDSQDAIGVFDDLSKPFTYVHHETLIDKLHVREMFVLQKRADRAIYKFGPHLSLRTSTRELFDRMSQKSKEFAGVISQTAQLRAGEATSLNSSPYLEPSSEGDEKALYISLSKPLYGSKYALWPR
ncbi:hypothetical protein EVAR_67101_1 [Eumeta japonica]|uniref:Uncharacterized protein n=1 Tax=Eumeta variegata TaxID=151549 RepID=A0A4C1ZW19_EUMVA|nr:hypothetical protein EVAR_67101_1 [Eumeta japonica]